jgi:hypothetical protein
MERQIIDPNPFMLSQNDKRGRTEFYMPLVFYAFAFLVSYSYSKSQIKLATNLP